MHHHDRLHGERRLGRGRHDTTHLLWNAVRDPEALFELAFDKLHVRELS